VYHGPSMTIFVRVCSQWYPHSWNQWLYFTALWCIFWPAGMQQIFCSLLA